jgi:hypothetical protein
MKSVFTRGLFIGAAICLAATAFALLSSPAQAVPSFARQTGQGCPVCHTNFPELTAFGRNFKLHAYVQEGGDKYQWMPPVSGMVIAGYTHTENGQSSLQSGNRTYPPNNNTTLEAASIFYAGKIFDNVGAFAQATYSGISRNFNWDNTDIRWARDVSLFHQDLVVGVTANNNPTVTDIYATLPAFGFPWVAGTLAPSPVAKTLLDGTLTQTVGGAGAYLMFDETVYAEFDVYKTLSPPFLQAVGQHPSGAPLLQSGAPYGRLALQHEFGSHFVSAGTFLMDAHLYPSRDQSQGADHYIDTGFDGEYQYLGDAHILTLSGRWIREAQHLPATQALGNSTNATNRLSSGRLSASYAYLHGEAKYAAIVSRFETLGTADSGLYSSNSANNSPNSNGWVFETDYLPFINSETFNAWPWAQLKLGLQYTRYNKFNGGKTNYDGNGTNANDNNTVFAFAWTAF